MKVSVVLMAVVAGLVVCGPLSAETPAESDAQFYMLLAYKQMATLGDAYQAVGMLANGDSKLLPAEDCRKSLVERKIAREDWGNDLKAPVTKGKLAYMVCQALGIKGGVTMRLFGPTQRYCLFECLYLELMVQGSTYQNCTGGELVATIDRADEYRTEKLTPAEAKDQPAEKPAEKSAEASAAAPVAASVATPPATSPTAPAESDPAKPEGAAK